MIVGLGIDLTEICRVESALRRWGERFTARVFTPEERAYCQSRAKPEEHYAARFAAKEAAMKALGRGLKGGISWQDLEVRRGERGKPELSLKGAAGELASRLGARKAWLTLSHSRGHAVAQVILEG